MDGTIIPQVTAHKHLGVMLNQKLTWNNHIDNLYTSCARRVGIMRCLRNKLQSQVFKKFFIGSIRPKLEYACAVWTGGPITKLIMWINQNKHCIRTIKTEKSFEEAQRICKCM